MSQIIYYFTHLFSTEGLPPRWLCGVWPPFQGWFYILSDLGIWSAYFTIPLLLMSFIRQRKDVPFPKIFWLFAMFIFACGMTHFFDAVMFWWPAYRLSGLLYFYTAVISWVTVFALIPVIPKALTLKSPARLEAEIQERIKAETALRESETKFRTLVDSVADYAIFYLSPEGYVTSWNKGAEKHLGYRPEEIIGQHISKFYPSEITGTGFAQHETEVAGREGRFEDEVWRIRKDGSRFWANVVLTAIRNEQGHLQGFAKVIRDLTQIKQAEEKLQNLNVELEEQVVQRTESLRKSLDREQLAMAIVSSIRAETELETIMSTTVNLLGQYVHADRCAFWIYDPEIKRFRISSAEYHASDDPRIVYTRDTAHPDEAVLPEDVGVLEVISLSDFEHASGFSQEARQAAQERGVKSLLSVPVQFDEQLLGRLQVHSVLQNCEWNEEVVKVVQQVADHVAVAIQHARIIQSLQESEARKAAIMNSTMDAVVMMNQEGRVVEWNASAERIFGFPRSEILKQPLEQFIIPERYRMAHHQGLEHYLKTGEGPLLNKIVEMPALRANGTEFISELSITRVSLAGPALFTGVLRDITERKRFEQALLESEERFRHMANASPVMIWMLNTSMEISYLNRTLLAYFGVEKLEDVLGKHWQTDWIHPDDLPALVESIQKAMWERHGFSLECRVKRADGTYRWVISTGVPRWNDQGELQGFIGTVLDIHDRKMLTESLEARVQERTAQLQAANKELEAFSYSVSHDLRAPLRTIDGFSQAILEMYQSHLDARGQDYLNRIRQGSQQMAKLIDDMLQLSRLTRGELNLENGINLSDMAERIAETLHAEDPERKVEIDIESGLIVRGDKRLLEAVLQNLLGNSWKYTSRHETAHIEVGSIQSGNATIYYVKDDGAGFEMQYADKLFGAFQRLHRQEEFPGTGVGLATVARIIHRHGGEVWADAELEKGATFYFTLQPINKQEMENAMSNQQCDSPCRG